MRVSSREGRDRSPAVRPPLPCDVAVVDRAGYSRWQHCAFLFCLCKVHALLTLARDVITSNAHSKSDVWARSFEFIRRRRTLWKNIFQYEKMLNVTSTLRYFNASFCQNYRRMRIDSCADFDNVELAVLVWGVLLSHISTVACALHNHF